MPAWRHLRAAGFYVGRQADEAFVTRLIVGVVLVVQVLRIFPVVELLPVVVVFPGPYATAVTPATCGSAAGG